MKMPEPGELFETALNSRLDSSAFSETIVSLESEIRKSAKPGETWLCRFIAPRGRKHGQCATMRLVRKTLSAEETSAKAEVARAAYEREYVLNLARERAALELEVAAYLRGELALDHCELTLTETGVQARLNRNGTEVRVTVPAKGSWRYDRGNGALYFKLEGTELETWTFLACLPVWADKRAIAPLLVEEAEALVPNVGREFTYGDRRVPHTARKMLAQGFERFTLKWNETRKGYSSAHEYEGAFGSKWDSGGEWEETISHESPAIREIGTACPEHFTIPEGMVSDEKIRTWLQARVEQAKSGILSAIMSALPGDKAHQLREYAQYSAEISAALAIFDAKVESAQALVRSQDLEYWAEIFSSDEEKAANKAAKTESDKLAAQAQALAEAPAKASALIADADTDGLDLKLNELEDLSPEVRSLRSAHKIARAEVEPAPAGSFQVTLPKGVRIRALGQVTIARTDARKEKHRSRYALIGDGCIAYWDGDDRIIVRKDGIFRESESGATWAGHGYDRTPTIPFQEVENALFDALDLLLPL